MVQMITDVVGDHLGLRRVMLSGVVEDLCLTMGHTKVLFRAQIGRR